MFNRYVYDMYEHRSVIYIYAKLFISVDNRRNMQLNYINMSRQKKIMFTYLPQDVFLSY